MADEQTEGAKPQEGSVEQGLEGVVAAAQGVAQAADAAGVPAEAGPPRTVDFILELPLAVTIEVGRARMTIQDLLQLGQGSVVELEKLAGEPLDIFINGKRIAIGEAVIVNEKFGVRVKEIIPPDQRLIGLK